MRRKLLLVPQGTALAVQDCNPLTVQVHLILLPIHVDTFHEILNFGPQNHLRGSGILCLLMVEGMMNLLQPVISMILRLRTQLCKNHLTKIHHHNKFVYNYYITMRILLQLTMKITFSGLDHFCIITFYRKINFAANFSTWQGGIVFLYPISISSLPYLILHDMPILHDIVYYVISYII